MNYPIRTIGELFKVTSGGTPSRKVKEYFENGEIPWVKTGDLKGRYANQPEEFITQEALQNSSAKLFPPNSVLLAMYGATIGACSILPFEAATNQACAALLPSEQCDSNYLYYFLQSIKDDLIRKGVGGAQPNISGGIIKKIKIPLPPLATQKKIAAILDAADTHCQKTKQLLAKYDELAQSIFLEMFGDPVTNPKGWEVGEIADLVSEVKYGTSSKAKDGGELEYLRMNNITYKGDMDYSKLKYIDLTTQELKKYTTKKYDLLFNRTNSKELVGKTGIVLDDKTRAIAGYLIRIRLKEKGNPFFVWAHLNSKWAKLTLENMCKNIVGMANINAKELQKIKTLVPPRKVQDAFEVRLKSINNQKINLVNSLNCSENLFNSLLQKAFKGELVK